MAIGGYLVIRGWQVIYRGGERIVTEDLYQYIRHPQYLGIFLITIGMLVQWPTLLTIVMWPVLMIAYYRLARREERVMESLYGEQYYQYRAQTPMFFPSLKAALSRVHFLGEK